MFSNECSKVNVGGYYLILIEFLSLWGFFTTSKESGSHGLSLEDRERPSFFMGTSFTNLLPAPLRILDDDGYVICISTFSRFYSCPIYVLPPASTSLPKSRICTSRPPHTFPNKFCRNNIRSWPNLVLWHRTLSTGIWEQMVGEAELE